MERMPVSSAGYSAPWIFLSHSGKQKPNFVKPLYQALLQANHRPFFAQVINESLPAGDEYPSRIFQACRDCKMGVVVLSKAYLQNLWLMLELQKVLLDPPNSSSSSTGKMIYPVFYDLNPGDLSNRDELKKFWKKLGAQQNWQRRTLQLQESMSSRGWDFQINLDLSSRAENIAQLKERSGTMQRAGQSNDDLVMAVTSTICARLPPPQKLLLDDGIKGAKRMGGVTSQGLHTLYQLSTQFCLL
ncbi:hypothetical protein L7F22_003654 [Adiantum nelumboides]|nr:hypothetical protein [Adiantum nelumboides]